MRSAVFVALLAVLLAPVPSRSVATRHVETFESASYADTTLTSANWDTSAGRLAVATFLPQLLGGAPTTDASMNIIVEGDIAFVSANQAGMWLFDVGNPAAPVYINHIVTTEQIREIEVLGDYAFLANNFAGLTVIDVRDPLSLNWDANFVTTGQTVSLDVAGDYVYLADGPAGMSVLDVSDPLQPTQVDQHQTNGYSQHVRVAGDFAFLADWNAGLRVFDITDPTNVVLVRTVDTPGLARAIAVRGNDLYLCDSAAGVHRFDITDPANPVLLGTVDTPGLARGIDVEGEFVYIADNTEGMQIYDRTSLNLVARTKPGLCHWIDARGNLGYTADGFAGIHVFRIADVLAQPETAGALSAGGEFEGDLVIEGDVGFVAGGSAGLSVFDHSTPASPILLTQYTGSGLLRDVAIDGDLAFVATSTSLGLLDVSNPAAPAELFSLPLVAGAAALDVDGDLLYAGGGSFLYSVDVSNTLAPAKRDSINVGGPVSEVVAQGDRVFLSNPTVSGFTVVDVSNPDSLSVLASYGGIVGLTSSLAVFGDFLYCLSASTGDVEVVDISDITVPAFASTFTVAGGAYDMALAGDHAFVAAGDSGVVMLDITLPLTPVQVGRAPVAGSARTVATAGDQVFVNGSGGGLDIVEVYERRIDVNGVVGATVALNAPSWAGPIVRYRINAVATGTVDWQASNDGGSTWNVATAYGLWETFPSSGADIRWQAQLEPVTTTAVYQVTTDWLYHAPVVTAVEDNPGDQGGKIRLWFARSGDEFSDSPDRVTGYRVERLTGSGTWSVEGTVPALGLDSYPAVVSTQADSTTAGGAIYTKVRVVGLTESGGELTSPPDSGYSIDNLPPSPPEFVEIVYTDINFLTWDSPPEPDVLYFNVYRGDAPGFTPDATNLVHTTVSTSWADANGGPLHFYKVTALDAVNESSPAAATIVSGARGDSPRAVFALHQNVPNPFNPSTMIRFDVARTARVRVDIFDVRGRLVRELFDSQLNAGPAEVRWNGRDRRGRRVASGVYFYRMSAPGFIATRKMTLLE